MRFPFLQFHETPSRSGRFWWSFGTMLGMVLLAVGSVTAQTVKSRSAVPSAAAATQTTPPVSRSGLPGGASALTEVHAGWSVNCRVDDGIKRCGMVHQENSNGRLLLALEVQAQVGDTTPAVLLLPFGLAVTQGVTLTVDELKSTPTQAFSTCLPGGCVVLLTLDQTLLQQLEAGNVLKVAATVADSAKPVAFAMPLEGFTTAFARVNVLSAD